LGFISNEGSIDKIFGMHTVKLKNYCVHFCIRENSLTNKTGGFKMDYDYVNFTNRIDAMVITENSENIIGTSDRANKESNSELQNKTVVEDGWMKEGLDNYVPGSNNREAEFISENYNDIFTVTGIPKNYLSLSENGHGQKIREEMEAVIYSWGRGEISDSQFKSHFHDICKDRRVFLAQCRYTTGRNEKDNKQIIEGIYGYSQKCNVGAMVHLCFEKGREIADSYGGGDTRNWVYYDADYYYKSEDLKNLLREAATEMAEEWGTDIIDFEDIEKSSFLTVNGGLDFNSTWNHKAYMCRGIASLNDFAVLPEPGFSFFYQENKHKIVQYGTLEIQAGICIVKYGKDVWKLDVPFNNSCCLGELADFFNTGELFERKGSVYNTGLLDFLRHFEIFTYVYGRNRQLAKS